MAGVTGPPLASPELLQGGMEPIHAAASGVLLTTYCTVPSPGDKDAATTMVEAVAGHQGARSAAKAPARKTAAKK